MRNLARLTNAAANMAGVPRDPDKRNMPLRKVVDGFRNEHGSEMERLECGHVQHVKWDHYGPTNAARRRCRQCAFSPEPEAPHG